MTPWSSLIFSKTFSIRRNILPLHSKRIELSIYFSVYSKLSWIKQATIFVDYQNGSEIYKWYQVLLQDLDENVDRNLSKDLDENLAWLTQKNEDPKRNKGSLTPPVSDTIIFLNFLHKKWIIRYIRCIEVNIRVSVCLLGCNFKFTGSLIFISAVTGTGALATAVYLIFTVVVTLC